MLISIPPAMEGEKSEGKSHPDYAQPKATRPSLVIYTYFRLIRACGFRLRLSQFTDRKPSSTTV